MSAEWGDLFPDEIYQLISAGIEPDEAVHRIRQLEQYSRTFPSLPDYSVPSWYSRVAWYKRLWAWFRG